MPGVCVETITANAVGRARRTTWGGRDYYVADMVLIREGVLNGSRGPLFYPLEEIRKEPAAWNHMPLVLGHPTVNGVPVSARRPEVLEKTGLGYVFEANALDRLSAQGWFDVERTRQVEPRVLAALEAGTPFDLSTGLFTENEKAPEGAVFNSPGGPKPYTHIARNYRPDHLAVFVPGGLRGACSLDDGCGVLVNELLPVGGDLVLNLDDGSALVVDNAGRVYKRDAKGRFASVAQATRAVASAEKRVGKAQAALDKAKAALKAEKSGLVAARKGLTAAKAREKTKTPRATKAVKKAKEKPKVDVGKHVGDTKSLQEAAVKGKRGKGGFEFDMPDGEFRSKMDAHFGGLNKSLNKEQTLTLAREMGLTNPKTKKDALANLRVRIENRRGTLSRAEV